MESIHKLENAIVAKLENHLEDLEAIPDSDEEVINDLKIYPVSIYPVFFYYQIFFSQQ